MKKLAFIIGAVFIVAAIAAGFFYFNEKRNGLARASQTDLPTALVEKGNLIATISTSGNVVLPDQQKLSFGVSGTIEKVIVENGSEVKKGDVLAILDTVPLQRAVAQAQANLEAAEINLKKTQNPYKVSDLIRAQASVVSAEASLAVAQKSLDDYLTLYTDTDRQLAEADVRNARLNLDSVLLDKQLNLRARGGNLSARSYEQELQDAATAREQAKQDYTKLIWPGGKDPKTGRRTNIYNLENIIMDTEYHLKLNPKKLGFIAEDAFDQTVEDAYWKWINADTDYQKLKLEEEKNRQTLQNNVDKAKDAINRVEQNLSNIKKWPEASEIELRKNQIQSAKQALTRAEADLADIKAGADPLDIELKKNQIEQNKISLETAKENLEKAKLVAPFDGIIFNLTAEPNQSVSAGTVLMQIVNPSKVRIDVLVDEVDIARVRAGQEAEITFDALPGMVLMGKVGNVSYVATRQSGITNFLTSLELDISRGPQERAPRPAGQGTGQRTPSKQGSTPGKTGADRTGIAKPAKPAQSVAIPGKPGQDIAIEESGAAAQPAEPRAQRARPVLRDGMTALVTINTEKREGVLTVPNRAITTQARNRIVKVKAGDNMEERQVRTGLTDGSRTEILSGLEEGETIVITPPQVRSNVPVPGKGGFPGKIGF